MTSVEAALRGSEPVWDFQVSWICCQVTLIIQTCAVSRESIWRGLVTNARLSPESGKRHVRSGPKRAAKPRKAANPSASLAVERRIDAGTSSGGVEPVSLPLEAWRKRLTPEPYRVLFE
jgi:hypothetical protein